MLTLYSMPSSGNSYKVRLLLAFLGLPYAHIGGEYGSGLTDSAEFRALNPAGKLPLLKLEDGRLIAESNAILLYLAEKFGAFLPTDPAKRTECLNWLFWQMGSAPFLGGGFGHFYAYAPVKYEYPINRYAMEVKRQLDVLNRHLADRDWMVGGEYTLADMAIWPWYGALVTNKVYEAAEFIEAHTYKNVLRWTEQIRQRPAVERGRKVNRAWGKPSSQLWERHDASDFELRTLDKLQGEQ